MNDRARAIQILRQAREVLTERLTELILESKDAILEDAHGFSYMSEINSIYEQIGARLSHVNSLLASLPETHEPPAEREAEPAARSLLTARALPGKPADADARSAALPVIAPLALPAPLARPVLSGEEARLLVFARLSHLGDVAGAGEVLAELFQISALRAVRCAQFYENSRRAQPEIAHKLLQIRQDVTSGAYNPALVLLHECFGFDAVEAVNALRALLARGTLD